MTKRYAAIKIAVCSHVDQRSSIVAQPRHHLAKAAGIIFAQFESTKFTRPSSINEQGNWLR